MTPKKALGISIMAVHPDTYTDQAKRTVSWARRQGTLHQALTDELVDRLGDGGRQCWSGGVGMRASPTKAVGSAAALRVDATSRRYFTVA